MQKDELATAKVSCAQIDFLRRSLTAQSKRVCMADSEAKRAREEIQKLREDNQALRQGIGKAAAAPSYSRRCKNSRAGCFSWKDPGEDYGRDGDSVRYHGEPGGYTDGYSPYGGDYPAALWRGEWQWPWRE